MMIKRFCLSVLLFLTVLKVFGQDTSYFDNNGVRVNSLAASNYFQITKPDGANTHLKDIMTYFKSGQLRSEALYSDTAGELCEGDDKEYYANGQLHRDIIYKAGKFNGHLLTYWENSKPKRIDSFHNGIFISGRCFDSLGRAVVHTIFEKAPEFHGGEAGLMHFLESEIRYPYKARKKGIQGKVIIGFIVDENGTVSHVKIVQNVNNELDEEAQRVIKRMPKWIPGMHDGKNVAVYYELPIMFKLE